MAYELFYAYLLGLLSILSPCCLVILPVILSESKVKNIISFFFGMVVTFGVLGIISALTGRLFTNFIGSYIYLFAGIVTLLAGLNNLNILHIGFPAFNFNNNNNNKFLLGLVYGGVALSCTGPLISSLLAYIIAKANIFTGFVMMVVFSLGFITPFLLFGFIITDKSISHKLMKHSIVIKKTGGILLLLVSMYLLFIGIRGLI